jgi:hypothetical protein
VCTLSPPELGSLVTKDKFPIFFEYLDHMKEDEAVKQSYLSTEAHIAFVKSYKAGVHDYSIADTKGTGITIYAKKED